MCKGKKRLSIIIPVYNAENKIEKCINSVLNQSYKDFELILVDDGSTDRSAVICEEYASKDNRITTIHIENSGTFQARKIGAQRAEGEILTFSDADDWIESNAFETAMQVFDENDPDIYTYAYFVGDFIQKHLYEEKLYLQDEVRKIIAPGMMFDSIIGRRRLDPSLCCKYIKKELFLKVTESVTDRITLGEDALVTYPAFCMAQSVLISNKAFYHYEINNTSCTRTFPQERVIEIKAFQKNITRLFDEMDMIPEMQEQIGHYVRTFLDMFVRNWYDISLSASARYVFPYDIISQGANIIIYGAGNVGKSYVNELIRSNYATIVGLADKKSREINVYNNVKVIDPQAIKEKEFDIILIAVFKEEAAIDIRTYLVELGISEEKIVWIKPVNYCL